MINLKKNDAIADAVRGIMEKELKGNQTKLDKNHNGKLDGQDFKILRGQKKATEEVEAVEENAFDYKSPRQPEPNGGSGVKKGFRYGGSKQKEKPEQEEPKEKKEEVRFTLKVMKERYEEPILDELINEVLSKDASAGAWIHDFVHSDNSKFDGKSTAERKKMALGAYYGKQDEEAVQEGLKSVAKKAFKALTGGSDEDQRKDLQRKMGVPQTGQKPKTEEVEQMDEISSGLATSYLNKRDPQHKPDLNSPETNNRDAKVAQGLSAAGRRKHGFGPDKNAANKVTGRFEYRKNVGATHTFNKEEVVMEGRPPTSQMDTPFVTNAENKPLNNAKELAAKTMKKMKSEMLGKAGTSE